MPRNASGTYTLPTGNPVVSGDIISSTWANDTMGDIASALTASLARDGSGGMTAPLRVVDGSVSVPGLAFGNETGSGLYRSAAGDVGLAILGNQILRMRSTGLDVTGAVGVSGNLAFSGTGNRITGDFSNATIANRVAFQTSTSNESTFISVIPNGTGQTAGASFYNNSSDLANSSLCGLLLTGTDFVVRATRTGSGTYLPMSFQTGGSERVRIDTSGNVGIGTSSPSTLVDRTILDLVGPSGGNGGLLRIANAAGTTVMQLYASTGTPASSTLRTTTASDLVFGTNNTERMRINSGGTVLVGTDSVTAATLNTVTRTNFWGLCVQDANNNNSLVLFRNTSGTQIGSITGTTNVAYNTSSDYRLKESIAPMTGALAKNELLNPVTYKWKVDGSDGQGFIAHELQSVFPDAVTGEKDAVDAEGKPVYQGVDTSFLVGHLVACVKELKAEVDALKAATV